MNTWRSIYRSLGFTGLLTIVFIVLRLTGIVGWSWWLVLSPIPLLFGAITVFVAVEMWWELSDFGRRLRTEKVPHDDWWDEPYKGTEKDGEGARRAPPPTSAKLPERRLRRNSNEVSDSGVVGGSFGEMRDRRNKGHSGAGIGISSRQDDRSP